MFSPDPKRSLFEFLFPDNFILSDIAEKYNTYLSQKRYTFDDIESVLMESLQGFNSPEYGTTPIEQTKRDDSFLGTQRYDLPKESVQKLSDKTFSITFRHVDGFLTYQLMQELLFRYYTIGEETTKHRGVFGNCILKLNRADGDWISKVSYHQCSIIGLTSLDLSYSSVNRDFLTFNVNFSYNDLSTAFNIPQLDLKS